MIENAAGRDRKKIVGLGPHVALAGAPQAPRPRDHVDAQGCCVLPGFVDAHSTSVGGNRGAGKRSTRPRRGPALLGRRIMRTSGREGPPLRGAVKWAAAGWQLPRQRPHRLEVKSGYGLTEAEERLCGPGASSPRRRPRPMVPTFFGANVVPTEPGDDYRRRGWCDVNDPRFAARRILRPLVAPGAFNGPRAGPHY